MSALFTQIFFIEMLRSWTVVRKGHTLEEVDKAEFHNEEHKMMVKLWTSDLKESERKLGNTYQIRDRMRWGCFMILIAGLYQMPLAQIITILAI